jgi:hypothetical protein
MSEVEMSLNILPLYSLVFIGGGGGGAKPDVDIHISAAAAGMA